MIGASIDDLEQRFRANVEGLMPAGESGAEEPRMLLEASAQLFEVCRRIENDTTGRLQGQGLKPEDLSEIGDYGIQLFSELAVRAVDEGREDQAVVLEDLTLPFAAWLAGRGAELHLLQPVVNALARYANSITDTADLARLSDEVEQLIAAVSADIRQDMDNANPQRPWRILLLNWGIIASRSHDTERMERAFEALTRHLPEDASQFFSEGMEQMQIIDYPPAVRDLVQRYHEQWSRGRALH